MTWSAETRVLLGGSAVVLAVFVALTWAVGEPIGWTAYTPLDGGETADSDPFFALVEGLEQRGWTVLGVFTVPLAVLAVALALAAWRPPGARTLVGLGALVLVCSLAVALFGFDPEPEAIDRSSLPPDVELASVLAREPTWVPTATLVVLAVALLALVAPRLGLVRPGAPFLAAGAVVLLGALALPWELGEVDLAVGLPFLGWLTVPYLVVAVAVAAGAIRPGPRAAAALLVLAGIAAAALLARGFTGGQATGPYAALAGLWLAALGGVIAAVPEHVRDARLVAVAGALLLAATPFLPWGWVTGTLVFYGPEGSSPNSVGFETSFDVAGNGVGPLLWLLPAALVPWVVLRRLGTPLLLALALVFTVGLGVLGVVLSDEVHRTTGLYVGTVGALLCLAGLIATATLTRERRTAA